MNHLTDEELASAYARTQHSAYFSLLYQRYYKKVYAHCLSFTTSTNTQAEDLTHDIFERVFRQINTYKGNARFSTWLYTVCRNYCLSQHQREQQRSRAVTVYDQGQESTVGPDSYSAYEHQLALLECAFEQLPDADQRILLARYGAGSSVGQLALSAQASESAIKMRLFRARERLRQALQQ
ncbi:RNA polymerase sigma factor [Spirosoma montaniterrae]|uniref:RNA polymerase subunit sigma-70 n=1 Tax=Spirosoma montaniterrae TaxID=1178516 RepID=A0A1P9WZS8_9BACT|nr:sigma-70 family RNA polymerase sigma factor [Spirosoma montaniterrae]AQG80848.1 hypothetical protein AWR27_16900 [Spirosoma montaniterrae]